jgi:hypothetical protein
MFGEIDEGRIRANAARQAWGFRMQGYDIMANKKLMQFQEKTNRTGTILSTAGSMMGAYGSYGGSGSSSVGYMQPSNAGTLSGPSYSPGTFGLKGGSW